MIPGLSREGATVHKSIISDGSIVSGAVSHSVISYKNIISKGVMINDSILLPNVYVEEDVKIKFAVVNENLRIKKGSKLIFDKPTLVDSTFKEVEPYE